MAPCLENKLNIELAKEVGNSIVLKVVKNKVEYIDSVTVRDLQREVLKLNDITKIEISILCKIFGISRSGFYHFLKTGDAVKKRNKYIADLIMDYEVTAFNSAGIKGVTAYLRSLEDYPELNGITERRVKSIMSDYEIIPEDLRDGKSVSIINELGKYIYGKQPPAKDDKIKRNFTQFTKPCTAWCTDITEIKTDEGKLYMCSVMDLFGRFITGYKTRKDSKRPIMKKTIIESKRFVEKHYGPIDEPIIFHSDRGPQFRDDNIQKFMKINSLMSSMSAPYEPNDNACIESFYSNMKCEYLKKFHLRTFEEAEALIERYVYYYNYVRVHQSTGYTPFDFWRFAALGKPMSEIKSWYKKKYA